MSASSIVDRFDQWIADRTTEGVTLEFKSGQLLMPENLKKTGRHQLTKAVASLANTEGGLVAIGVAEAADEPGWSVADHIEPAPGNWNRERMLQFLNDNISPSIPKLDVDVEKTAGGTLVLVHVPVSFLGHQNRRKDGEGGEYRTRRANGVSEPLDGRDVRQLLMRTQLPDPVLRLVVPEKGERAQEKGDILYGISWQLLLTTRAAMISTYRVTLCADGFEAEGVPGAFNRPAAPLTFGRDGFVSSRHDTLTSIFAGVDEQLAGANIRMRPGNPHHFLAALVQVPGVTARLFAWHIEAVGRLQRIEVRTPDDEWWELIDIQDPLGERIPFERG